jgi:hypothetical protein
MLNMTLNSDLNEQVLFMVTTAKNITSPTDIINGVGMQYLCEMLHNMFSIARSLTESYLLQHSSRPGSHYERKPKAKLCH